jgi:hypothetical protein
VKASADYLLSLQSRSGNFPCATDELGNRARPETDELVHWCHGAPGNLDLTFILSCVYGSVTNKNGFWTGFY